MTAGDRDESAEKDTPAKRGTPTKTSAGRDAGLNPEQEDAVRAVSPHIAVIAGPGTGKTRTLISRIRYLLEYRRVSPAEITAVTFTNQAASEIRGRIGKETGKRQAGRSLQVGTFHSICLDFLEKQGEEFSLAGEAEQRMLAEQAIEEAGADIKPAKFLEMASRSKSGMDIADAPGSPGPGAQVSPAWQQAFQIYEKTMREQGLLDFDDLLLRTAERIESGQAHWAGKSSSGISLSMSFRILIRYNSGLSGFGAMREENCL